MAYVYTFAGQYDLAIDNLEYLLSIPSWTTPEYLRADPLFEPLHDLPRFKALMAKYEQQFTYR